MTEAVLLVDGVGNAVRYEVTSGTQAVRIPMTKAGVQVDFRRTDEQIDGHRIYRQTGSPAVAVRHVRRLVTA